MNIDEHLTEVVKNYNPAGFIADQIFPIFPVTANTIKSAGIHIEARSIKADVTVGDRASADPIFVRQFEEGRVMRALGALFLEWEVRVAEKITNPKNVRGVIRPNRAWTDLEKSTPIEDINTALRVMEFDSNSILFSGTAWRNFRRNKKVIELATGKDSDFGGLYPSISHVEELLGVRVLVGNAWQNTDKIGTELNLRQVWGDHVLIYHTPPEPSIETPSFGYYFRWVEEGIPNMQIDRLPYNSRTHCSEIEIAYHQAEVITGPEYGCLIQNVTKKANGAANNAIRIYLLGH